LISGVEKGRVLLLNIFFKEKFSMKERVFVRMAVGLFLFLCLAAGVFAGGTKESGGGTGGDRPLITIEIYDQAANYQGIQPGWYGELIKQKFNIQNNIIAPQLGGGSALFQTRAASGNLGDIVILNNGDFTDSVQAGLIKDISADISKYPNLMVYKQQIDMYNKGIGGISAGQIFGIPCQMTSTSPTKWSEPRAFTSPWVPWDYFVEAGAPRLRNLDDLLNVLAQMQKNHPTNKDGEKAYAITLWADWDGSSIENVNQPLKWYGAEPAGALLVGADGSLTPMTDDNGQYLKLLSFFFKANQMGLVDPDSGTQQWDSVMNKMSSKRVYLLWNNWQTNFTNSTAKGNNRENFVLAPIDDMKLFQPADTYFGSERTWGIGSRVSGEKYTRILEFLDWYTSSEGNNYSYNGIPGFTYEKLADGTYTRTTIGETRYTDNPPVPAVYGLGTGGWNDGNNWINQWPVAEASPDPETGYGYMYSLWPDEIRKAATTTSKEWSAKYGGAANEMEYLEKNNRVIVVPSVNTALPSDTTDIQLIRSQCGDLLCDTSWKMIFAGNEAEFNKLWADMKVQLAGFGWDKLVAFDRAKYQVVVNARAEAAKSAR
jgi:multiple sugar transport system substrate-binding protein/putative aldouronate transport system substrate-binding protein